MPEISVKEAFEKRVWDKTVLKFHQEGNRIMKIRKTPLHLVLDGMNEYTVEYQIDNQSHPSGYPSVTKKEDDILFFESD